jgi:hypothetical protein
MLHLARRRHPYFDSSAPRWLKLMVYHHSAMQNRNRFKPPMTFMAPPAAVCPLRQAIVPAKFPGRGRRHALSFPLNPGRCSAFLQDVISTEPLGDHRRAVLVPASFRDKKIIPDTPHRLSPSLDLASSCSVV